MPGREKGVGEGKKGKKRERNITLLLVSGVWYLLSLEHFPINRKTACTSVYILKASLFGFAFYGKTSIAQACSLWATGRGKILLSEQLSSGERQTLSFPAWASAHGPLSLPSQWDLVVPHSLPVPSPQRWLHQSADTWYSVRIQRASSPVLISARGCTWQLHSLLEFPLLEGK